MTRKKEKANTEGDCKLKTNEEQLPQARTNYRQHPIAEGFH